MKVLVTGASGFVGTWLTKRLIDLGHEVRVLSRSGQFKMPYDTSSVEIIRGDVTDIDSTVRSTRDVDTVFHLAGVVGYSPSMRQQMVLANVVGTSNVIEATQKSRCRKLVYMSSVVAIGAGFSPKEVLNEDSKYNLSHLNLGYFETKHRAEELVRAAVQDGTIDAVMINPSTIYGPGDAKKGSRSTQLKVAQGRFPFYTPGGVGVVHIEDVIDALMSVWKSGRSGERYVITSENLYIRDLFQIIADTAGVKPPRICLSKNIVLGIGHFSDFLGRFGKKGPLSSENAWASVLYHWFDNSKAKKELGFNPRPARQAIEESVLWMKSNGLLAR